VAQCVNEQDVVSLRLLPRAVVPRVMQVSVPLGQLG